MIWQQQLAHYTALVDDALERLLSGENGKGYDVIFEAVKYSTMAGGKRLRPALTLAFCTMCGGQETQALPFACALEMIHTYSLIHDDLPCMDNDDLRRGKPTSHKVYGEAMAVLAGDALLTEAFRVATASDGAPVSAETKLRCANLLAGAAGMNGMVGGQVLDLQSEGKTIELEQLELLQSCKTGALIAVACVLGCVAAGASEVQIATAERFGAYLGRAFQIRDDILDIEGDAVTLGKTIGKDQIEQKSTFPSLLGLPRCKELVRTLSEQAIAALDCFENTDFLRNLTENLIIRNN